MLITAIFCPGGKPGKSVFPHLAPFPTRGGHLLSSKLRLSPTPVTAFAVALLLVANISPASAIDEGKFAFKNTKDLYDICSVDAFDPEEKTAQIACTAFIEAAVQYHDAVSDRKHLKRLVCYPQGATIGDGRTAFLAWAKENPGNAKLMDEVPVVGLVRALAKAYPCK
jgi:hypothetical protein